MAQSPHERSLVKNLADKPFVLIGVHLNYEGDDASTVKKLMVMNQLNWRSFVDRGPLPTSGSPPAPRHTTSSILRA